MYSTDSFFTLNAGGQVGLLLVSLCLAICTSVLLRRLTSGRSWAGRIGIWAILYYVFVWLSPQIYYAYYLLIFDGLPAQWVIGAPDPPTDVLRLLTLTGPKTISANSLGILGWVLLPIALWPQRSNCRDAAN